MKSIYIRSLNTNYKRNVETRLHSVVVVYYNFFQSEQVGLGSPWHECAETGADVKYYYYEGQYSADVSFSKYWLLNMLENKMCTLEDLNDNFQACYRSCYQNEVFKACGCQDPRFAIKKGRPVCPLHER